MRATVSVAGQRESDSLPFSRMAEMLRLQKRNRGAAFFVPGLAFVAIGALQDRTFVVVGIAFLAIGAVLQSRRA